MLSDVDDFLHFMIDAIWPYLKQFPVIKPTFSKALEVELNPQICLSFTRVFFDFDVMPWKHIFIIIFIHAWSLQA